MPETEGPRMTAGQNFVLSLFDRLWHKDISQEEAIRLMELGIEEVCQARCHLTPFENC